MNQEFKDTGNGEYRLHDVPQRVDPHHARRLLMTGSREECLAEYIRLCEEYESDNCTLVVCDESGFPICAA